MEQSRKKKWYRRRHRDNYTATVGQNSDSSDPSVSEESEEENSPKRRNVQEPVESVNAASVGSNNSAQEALSDDDGNVSDVNANGSEGDESANDSDFGALEMNAGEDIHGVKADIQNNEQPLNDAAPNIEGQVNRMQDNDGVNLLNADPGAPEESDAGSDYAATESEASEVEAESSEDDDDSSESEDEDAPENNTPIFDGAHITFKESLLAILVFILTHKLTGLCVSDLLALISLHCGPGNICVKTFHRFRKYFKMIGKKLVVCHYYCENCQIPLQGKDSICNECQQNNSAYFIELPIVSQLQVMFKRPGFYEALGYRFTRVKKHPHNIEDVYDGFIYQQQVDSGFLANRNNISFFMYFDGISLFKSSKFSIWPIYLTINELKYKLRTKKQNTIIAGLWFGKTKPNPNLFLQPLQETLTNLENVGAEISLPNGAAVTVKAKVLGAVGDLPAKALFMKIRQYNGSFSCSNCMEQGGRYGLDNNTIQVFPYRREMQLRTNEEFEEFAELAMQARQRDPDASVYGVKGPSLLSSMLPNFVLCMAIDIMHGVFLGVIKTVANLWFDPQYSNSPFSISGLVHIVDARMKNIKPPSSYQRVPRSFWSEIALLKAADWKLFMCHYALPVLLGILPPVYWLHLCKLVTAVGVLTQDSISLNDIDHCEELLHSFVADFQNLYHLRYMSLTIHQLLHLCMVVKNLGPAWVYSCFFYESLNGELSRLVHGSRHAALQISSSCSILLNLPVLTASMVDSPSKDLCLKLQKSWVSKIPIVEHIDNETGIVGDLKKYNPVPQHVLRLLMETFAIHNEGQCKYFFRLKKKATIYSSEKYLRSTRKLSCFVKIISNNIPFLCKILDFIKWSSCRDNCNCNECQNLFVCIVQVYECIPWELHDAGLPVTPSYLHKVSSVNQAVRVFPVTAIDSAAIYIPVGDMEFMSLPVNKLEIE